MRDRLSIWKMAYIITLCGCIGAVAMNVDNSQAATPKVRVVQLKASSFLFDLRLEPGAPKKGEVVKISIEMVKVPEIPDPVYGERIPVKGADIIIELFDSKEDSLLARYRVHSLQDAGSYGLHLTPLVDENLVVKISGIHKGVSFADKFELFEGALSQEGPGKVAGPASPSSGSRLPARPSRGPAMPGQGAVANQGPTLPKIMKKMGENWVKIGQVLFLGANDSTKMSCKNLSELSQQAALIKMSDEEYLSAINEMKKVVERLNAQEHKDARQTFKKLGSQHCNRCHYKMRWKMIDSLSVFSDKI
jgi:hypothetical protein